MKPALLLLASAPPLNILDWIMRKQKTFILVLKQFNDGHELVCIQGWWLVSVIRAPLLLFVYFHWIQWSNSFACLSTLVPTQFYWCKDNVPQLLRDLSKMDLMGFILSRDTSSGMTKNTGRESVYVTWATPGTTLDCTWGFFTFSFIYLCLELWPSPSYVRQTA